MEQRVIDTVTADTLTKGDWIGAYDNDLQSEQAYEVLSVEDRGEGIEVTLDWYDQPVVLYPYELVSIYGY